MIYKDLYVMDNICLCKNLHNPNAREVNNNFNCIKCPYDETIEIEPFYFTKYHLRSGLYCSDKLKNLKLMILIKYSEYR